MSYYHNIAQPLTKEDFEKGIEALSNPENFKIRPMPEFYIIPPEEVIKKFNLSIPKRIREAQCKGS